MIVKQGCFTKALESALCVEKISFLEKKKVALNAGLNEKNIQHLQKNRKLITEENNASFIRSALKTEFALVVEKEKPFIIEKNAKYVLKKTEFIKHCAGNAKGMGL